MTNLEKAFIAFILSRTCLEGGAHLYDMGFVKSHFFPAIKKQTNQILTICCSVSDIVSLSKKCHVQHTGHLFTPDSTKQCKNCPAMFGGILLSFTSLLQRVLQKQSSLGRGMSTSVSASSEMEQQRPLKSPSVKSPTGSAAPTPPQSLPSPPAASAPQPPPPALISSPASAPSPLSSAPPAPQLAPVLIPTAAPLSPPTPEPASIPKSAPLPVVQPNPVNVPKPEPPSVSKSDPAPISVPKPVPVPDPISVSLLQPAPVPTPAPSISPATSSAPVNVPCSPTTKIPDAPEGKSLSHTETAV